MTLFAIMTSLSLARPVGPAFAMITALTTTLALRFRLLGPALAMITAFTATLAPRFRFLGWLARFALLALLATATARFWFIACFTTHLLRLLCLLYLIKCDMMEISEIPGFKIISLFIREENSKIFFKKTEDYKFAELFIDLDFFKNLKQDAISNKESFERGKYLNYNNDLSYQCIIHKYYPPFNFDIIFLSRDLLFDLRYKDSVNNKVLDDTRTIFRCHLKGLQLNRYDNDSNNVIDSNYISNIIGKDQIVTIKVGDVDIYSRILIDILLPNGFTYSKHLLEKFPRLITKYNP